MYEGNVVPMADGKFHCFILKISTSQPGHDTVKEYDATSMEEAQIWIDDETYRLSSGKGLWD